MGLGFLTKDQTSTWQAAILPVGALRLWPHISARWKKLKQREWWRDDFFNAGNKWFDCKNWLLAFGIYIYIYHILFIPTTFNVYYVTMTFVIFCFWAPQFCRWNRFGVWELGKSRHFNLHISTFGFHHLRWMTSTSHTVCTNSCFFASLEAGWCTWRCQGLGVYVKDLTEEVQWNRVCNFLFW